MLLNKIKRNFLLLLIVIFSVHAFAATTDLSVRFLDKAEEAFENGNVDDAYKYVNQALAVSKDEASKTNVLFFAQTVYTQKLVQIQERYDEMALIDLQMNLEKYPTVENTKIKKLIKQIEQAQENKEKAAEKADKEEQRKVEQERFESQQKSMEDQAAAMKEQAAALKEQAEASKQSQQELKDALDSNFKEIGSAFTESAKETKRSTTVIAFAVIGIAFIIFIVVLLIIVIVRKGFKQQQVQQEQYVQAFKMLAANQNTTNRLMLGGITDLYGANPQMRLAGSSTWAPAMALPDIDISENDEEEIKQLAVKCEEIGAQIDSATGRKNNSKNVSELVYKLSMELGLPQGMSMLNFCAAMIYDAGFLDIDPDLLTSTSLSEEQKAALKKHVNLSEKHLDFVPKKYWSVFEDAAMKHHENMDGSGYPNGLKGDEIPQVARLIHVAESFVSLSSKRTFRDAMDKETAVQKLREQPDLYDQEVVDALDKLV
ncbi:MAG: hypothetical protein K5681_07040 [Treponema sp.]|nr:hypothetical protein [Treponema sp.]